MVPGRPKPQRAAQAVLLGLPKPCSARGCASSNAELQPAGMHRRPGLLMAVNVISNLTKVPTVSKLLAICFFLSVELPVLIEARPVDGDTGGEVHLKDIKWKSAKVCRKIRESEHRWARADFGECGVEGGWQ